MGKLLLVLTSRHNNLPPAESTVDLSGNNMDKVTVSGVYWICKASHNNISDAFTYMPFLFRNYVYALFFFAQEK